MLIPLWATRCITLVKPGVGGIHLHAARWRPGRVREVGFTPAAPRSATGHLQHPPGLGHTMA